MSFASYKWSSALMWFSTLAPASKRTAIDIMANLSANVAPWKTDIELKTAISFSHELVHYYKDLLTGVGHSDYLTYRDFLAESFMWANQLLSVTSELPFGKENIYYEVHSYYKYCYDEYLKVFDRYSKKFVYAKSYFINKEERIETLNKQLKQLFRDSIKFEKCEEFLIESIFEAEAVVSVYDTLRNLGMSKTQSEIYDKYDFLILPHKMEEKYYSTISFVLRLLKDSSSGISKEDLLLVVFRMLLFLADVSEAYPTEDKIKKSGISKVEFDPGIKFLRLAYAIHSIDEKESKTFLAAFRDGDAHSAEQVLLNGCSIKYPHSKEIYTEWAKLFETMLSTEDNIIIELRRNSCINRINNKMASFTKKNLTQWVFHNPNVPINFLTSPDGITSYFVNEQLDRKFQMNLLLDLMKLNTDLQLYELFFQSGKFACPFRDANVCGISTEKCSCITSLKDIPKDEDCLVQRRASPFLKQ